MQKQIDRFAKDKFTFYFFKAVDGTAGEHEQFSSFFNRYRTILRRAKDSSDTEKACYASHYMVWQKCIELDAPIVVLEDDVNINDNFTVAMNEIVGSKFDYVRLHGTNDPGFKRIGSTNFYFTLKDVAGALGYYITPSGARAFSKSRFWDLPVDLYMDFVARHKVDNVIYIPHPVSEGSILVSSIGDRDKASNLAYKVVRELYRPFIQTRRTLFEMFYKPPSVHSTR